MNERYSDYSELSTQAEGPGTVFLIVMLGMIVLMVASMWKIFTKAGKPGWAAIVPIYNLIVLMEIVGRPVWWVVLMIIPIVNLVVLIIVLIDLAKSFGRGAGTAVGMLLLPFIFYPMLAFGSATYQGPAAGGA